jgi:hypothetical protein
MRSHSPIGHIMLQVTKEVSKKVTHPGTQKEVKRSCKVTFNAVDTANEDWIEDALAICGGDSSLSARVFNFGLWSWLRQQETNQLGKVDEVSKGLAKAIAGFTAMGIPAEQARTMILANPDLSSRLQNTKFEQFVETSVEDFAAYQTDTDATGVKTSRFPDITKMEEEKPSEEESEAK